MKKSILTAIAAAAFITTAQAENYLHGRPNTSYQTIYGTTYGSDGSTSRQTGNQVYNSDGSSIQRIGNQTYGSDGTTCQHIGNQTYCN